MASLPFSSTQSFTIPGDGGGESSGSGSGGGEPDPPPDPLEGGPWFPVAELQSDPMAGLDTFLVDHHGFVHAGIVLPAALEEILAIKE